MCEVTIVAILNMLNYFKNVIVGKSDKINEIEKKRQRERKKRRKKRTGDMCQTLVTLVERVIKQTHSTSCSCSCCLTSACQLLLLVNEFTLDKNITKL